MIRAFTADDSGIGERAVEEAVSLALQGRATAWIDVEIRSREPEDPLGVLDPLRIHPLVLEDMVAEVNRPKVDDYGDYLYLVVHSARWQAGERPAMREIDIVVGQRFLVTYHEGETRSITEARQVLPRRPNLLAKGPAPLLHFILDVLVDHYLPIMDVVSDQVDRLEEDVFRDLGGGTPMHERIVALKRGMSRLRRIVGPQRDTVLALTRDEYRAIPAEIRPYLRDVYDRLARVNDLLDSFRDEIASLLDLHVSIVSNRLNEIIKRLTVIATIGLPLTLVTSYYGMNFALPEYRWPHATLYAMGILLATALGTWWYLRWRRWL